MRIFERLLSANQHDLETVFGRFLNEPRANTSILLKSVQKQMQLNQAQLTCVLGFNPHTEKLPALIKLMGFAGNAELQQAANALYGKDIYNALTIDDALAIDVHISRMPSADRSPDVVANRLQHLEREVEITINPILLGSYRTEVRAKYEHALMTKTLAYERLNEGYAMLRSLSNEVSLMVVGKVFSGVELLSHPGVSAGEKRKLVTEKLVSAAEVREYLQSGKASDEEKQLLRASV